MGTRSLVTVTVILVAALLAPVAVADDDAPGEVQPRKIRVRVLREDAADAAAPAQRRHDPMDTVMRWMMKHAAHAMAKVADGSARTPVHAWFDGGPDVPLADLRDALKADGFTADELMTWFGERVASALHGLMLGGPRHGRAAMPGGGGPGGPPWMRRMGPMGPGAMGGGGFGPPWMRGRGAMSGGPGSAPPSGPMPGMGPMPTTGRTIILWNDGTGWQHREVQGGAHGAPWMQGHGAGPWTWGGAGGAGAGPQPPGAPPRDAQAPWMEMLEGLLPHGAQGGAEEMPDVAGILELLRSLQGRGATPPRAHAKDTKSAKRGKSAKEEKSAK